MNLTAAVLSFFMGLPSSASYHICDNETKINKHVELYMGKFSKEELDKMRMIKNLNVFLRENYGFRKGNAFCHLYNKIDTEESSQLGLAVSRKDSFESSDNPLHVHYIGLEDKVREKASLYPSEDFDIYTYSVYTPKSQTTRTFLRKSYGDIAQLFVHERFHDEVEFKRILEESMADVISYIVIFDFINSHPKWNLMLPDVKKDLNKQLKRADIILKVYKDLQTLYASNQLPQSKILHREMYMNKIKNELDDKTVNNATIAREIYYLQNFRDLYDIHILMGNDTQKSITFYKSLPSQLNRAEAAIKEKKGSK
jgi:hypothetical protein